MHQFLSRPDRHFSLCGNLRAAVVERAVSCAPAFMRGLRAVFACDFHAVSRTTPEDIRALAPLLRAALSDGAKCAIGNETQIRAAAEAFTDVQPLFRE